MAEAYNTNLAAEFYVLSVLHRLGAEASLTLGNKKAVDILVVRGEHVAARIDVKGVAGAWDWPADNVREPEYTQQFVVLVSFEGRIGDVEQLPSVWVVPAVELTPFVRTYQTRRVVSRAAMRAEGERFKDAWRLLGLAPDAEPGAAADGPRL